MRRTIGSYRFAISRDICEQTQFGSFTTRVLRLAHSWLLDLLLASVILLVPFATCDAQAQRKLEGLQQDLKPGSTRDVVCIRRRERPPVQVPMEFKIGDRLISDRRKLNARIQCGKATLTAWAPFRLEFKANPPLKTCYVGYSSKPGGGLIVHASGPTGVLGPGAAKMESANTRYGITFDRVRGRPRKQWLVYEGKVTVRSGRSIATVTEGEKLVAKKAGTLATQKITSADIQQAARVYASMDVSQMPPSYGKGVREAAFVRLQTLHQAVFSNPKNQEHQLRLADEQKSFGIPVAESDRLKSDPKTRHLDFTLKPNTTTTKVIGVLGCKKALRFQITLKNLPFARLVSAAEGAVAAGQDTEFLVEFDASGLKPGIYQGEILVPCLDCYDDCVDWVGRVIVSVNISADQGELKVTTIEKTPVAVPDKPTPKAPQSTESKTGIKPKPESGAKSDKKPQRDLKTWDIPLPPDTKTVRAFQINNPCAQDRTVNITLTDLPFARLLAKPQIKIKAGATIHAPIEFDTTGMKIGNYQGLLKLTCRDCFKQDVQCSPKSRPRSLNVTPVDFLRVNVNIK